MVTTYPRLSRSQHDRVFAGVVGGLARYLGLDPTLVRIICLPLLCAAFPAQLIYLLLWLLIPSAD